MKKTIIKNYTEYRNDKYDEMKSLLNKSKRLFEQVEDEQKMQREEEKTKEYEVSSGKISGTWLYYHRYYID